MKITSFVSIFILSIVSVLAQPPQEATPTTSPISEKSLTNGDILKLCQAGLGDDVVVAKINSVSRVSFKLEIDDLIELKKAGVGQSVITAMVNRSGASNAKPQTAGPSPGGFVMPGSEDLLIRLTASDGEHDLVSIAGHMATTYAYVTVLIFSDFPGMKADVRTKDHRPSITVQSSKSPKGRFYLVRCESNKRSDDRSVKMGRHGVFSNKDLGAPDGDWTVPFDVQAVQPGVWRLVLKDNLKPGEYGLFGGMMGASELYDFGVDG